MKQRPVLLIDRNGHERSVQEHWNEYRVPRDIHVNGDVYRHCDDRDGLPVYREVADGHVPPVGLLRYQIIDTAGRSVVTGTLDCQTVPPTLPSDHGPATLCTIAGPDGRVVYQLQRNVTWLTRP